MVEDVKKLSIKPYKRHAVMCVGKSCGENMPLLKYIKKRLVEEGLDSGDDAVRANRAGCLGVCEQGPIMVVYPEGAWYSDLDEDKVDEIIASHLKAGKPVDALAFHVQPANFTK
ncbi:MAG: NAD(P)H-dependent oxidoreductase subunit E [Ghiorsea sp.]